MDTVIESYRSNDVAKAQSIIQVEKRIDDLVAKGYLTTSGADILHRTRVLGNEAAHEVQAATLEQLNAALDIAEHLLNGAYVLPHVATKLPTRRLKDRQ